MVRWWCPSLTTSCGRRWSCPLAFEGPSFGYMDHFARSCFPQQVTIPHTSSLCLVSGVCINLTIIAHRCVSDLNIDCVTDHLYYRGNNEVIILQIMQPDETIKLIALTWCRVPNSGQIIISIILRDHTVVHWLWKARSCFFYCLFNRGFNWTWTWTSSIK